ncbi:MAG: type II toxin-antitoxin system RelE/ParE family toxin [Actinobacteria bacterium]|nr:type II toxin-antitoxin system RelE/ParE family toxin [Actinomycetota bacterium]
MFKIFETDQFLKDLKKLDKPEKMRLYSKILNTIYPQLKNNPYFGKNIKKLKAYNPDTWRYRIGSLRLFYEISDKEKIAYITTIECRGSSY